MRAAATTAVARVHPIRASHGKVLIPAMAVDMTGVPKRLARHVMTCPAGHVTTSHAHHAMRCNARTRVAPGLTWASSATILMIVNPPAMYRLAFRLRGCRHAALAADAAATVVTAVAVAVDAAGIAAAVAVPVAVAEIGAAADLAPAVAAAAGATQVADFRAESLQAGKPAENKYRPAQVK